MKLDVAEESAIEVQDLESVRRNEKEATDDDDGENGEKSEEPSAKAAAIKSVSFSEENQSALSSSTSQNQQPQLRLRGPLAESSATAELAAGNVLSRPWPKDVNTPLKQLASSTSTYNTSTFSKGPCSCFSWSRRRVQVATIGCTSSCLVLTTRLLLDSSPSAYVIHSVIVFFDMILIHLFTFNVWLSVLGELLTIIFFLSFHFTNEKVFELLETTLIAALCSMHMIFSRKKHMDHEQKLEDSLRIWHQLSLRSNPGGSSLASSMHRAADIQHEALLNDNHNDSRSSHGENKKDDIESLVPINVLTSPPSLHHSQNLHFQQDDNSEGNSTSANSFMKTCGEHFFGHFLDGSAGVMYTSFVGLIIDDLIHYGEKTKC